MHDPAHKEKMREGRAKGGKNAAIGRYEVKTTDDVIDIIERTVSGLLNDNPKMNSGIGLAVSSCVNAFTGLKNQEIATKRLKMAEKTLKMELEKFEMDKEKSRLSIEKLSIEVATIREEVEKAKRALEQVTADNKQITSRMNEVLGVSGA